MEEFNSTRGGDRPISLALSRTTKVNFLDHPAGLVPFETIERLQREGYEPW